MAKPVQVEICGITYPTILEASKNIGCSPAFIRNSIKKANGSQEVLDQLIEGYEGIKKQVNVAGYTFQSIRELVKQTGISEKRLRTIRKRCKTEKEFEQKVLECSMGIYLCGEWYWCFKSAAKSLGISEKLIISLVDKYDYSQKMLDNQIRSILLNKKTK